MKRIEIARRKQEAFLMYVKGDSMKEIARKFGVVDSTIRAWNRKGDWDKLIMQEQAKEARLFISRIEQAATNQMQKGLECSNMVIDHCHERLKKLLGERPPDEKAILTIVRLLRATTQVYKDLCPDAPSEAYEYATNVEKHHS